MAELVSNFDENLISFNEMHSAIKNEKEVTCLVSKFERSNDSHKLHE